MPDFQPPDVEQTAWRYRSVAQRAAGVAYAAASPKSPHRGREDLVKHALAMVDWLVSECSDQGWWWRKHPPEGDPNVNRFTLAPLLDAVQYLRRLPEGKEAWPRWKDTLNTAIALQRRAYRKELSWDWGGRAAGEYANQDAYYVLIMALSARLFDRPEDMRRAEEMVAKIADNVLPDGGIHYIGVTNEVPVYHGVNLHLLGRYATLTGSSAVRKLFQRTSAYWPLVMTAEGYPECWSDVWWKHYWAGARVYSIVISAGSTGNPVNQWLMWRVLERKEPKYNDWATVCAAPYWTGLSTGEPLPERYVRRDRNMRGIRGRDGQWYFGVCRGRGLKDTFVGGLLTDPNAPDPLIAALRGAQIEVGRKSDRGHGLWLSQIDDNAALSMQAGVGGSLGVQYCLQPSKINSIPTPETPPTPWRVTQVWRAAADGILGTVTVEATKDQKVSSITGRLALGPAEVSKTGENRWECGPLKIRAYRTLTPPRIDRVPRRHRPNGCRGLVMERQIEKGRVPAGTEFSYTVWIGPDSKEAPAEVQPLSGNRGWLASWSDGRRCAVLFNPTGDAVEVEVPWAKKRARLWQGLSGKPKTIQASNESLDLVVSAKFCVTVTDLDR